LAAGPPLISGTTGFEAVAARRRSDGAGLSFRARLRLRERLGRRASSSARDSGNGAVKTIAIGKGPSIVCARRGMSATTVNSTT
jgi:hypothetical protein